MALAALILGSMAGLAAARWPGIEIGMAVGGGVLALAGCGLIVLALRPAIEIHETHLAIGRRAIPLHVRPSFAEVDQVCRGGGAPAAPAEGDEGKAA